MFGLDIGVDLGTANVLVYEKVNIDPDAFATMRKAKAYDVCWDMEKKAAPRYLQLHMCINELDRRTNTAGIGHQRLHQFGVAELLQLLSFAAGVP